MSNIEITRTIYKSGRVGYTVQYSSYTITVTGSNYGRSTSYGAIELYTTHSEILARNWLEGYLKQQDDNEVILTTRLY